MFDTLANGGGHPVMTTCRTRPRRGVPDEVSGTSPPAPRHRPSPPAPRDRSRARSPRRCLTPPWAPRRSP